MARILPSDEEVAFLQLAELLEKDNEVIDAPKANKIKKRILRVAEVLFYIALAYIVIRGKLI
jgi:hypothetical protein